MRKYHYIYKTKSESGKYYIGRHSTNRLDDGYLGSGRWVKSVRQKEKLSKQIVRYCDSFDEAIVVEESIIREHISDPLCMNFIISGKGAEPGKLPWPEPMKEETKQKISKARHGIVFSHSTKQKMSEARKGKTPWNKGVSFSVEVKMKMSEAKIGKTHSVETKRKMAQSRLGNTHTKGKRWFNNSIKSVMTVVCPDGYTPGRIRWA